MKKPLILAGLSAFMLIGAAYPELPAATGAVTAMDQDAPAPAHYRPCRGRNDDRCIQLYERGVRASYARWLAERTPARLAAAEHHPRHPHARHERRTRVLVRCDHRRETPARGELG